MTKKDMKVKYEELLDMAIVDKEFYTNELFEVIEFVCDEKEIEENCLTRLVNLTINRTEEAQREMFIRDWTLYQKTRREIMIIKEILSDLK